MTNEEQNNEGHVHIFRGPDRKCDHEWKDYDCEKDLGWKDFGMKSVTLCTKCSADFTAWCFMDAPCIREQLEEMKNG